MKIELRGAYIIHKDGEKYIDCRDEFAINVNSYRFSIADGVSRSFYPGIWAKLLVDSYVNLDLNASFEETVSKCSKNWFEIVETKVSMPDVKFYTRTAFKRRTPGLATFIGLTLLPDTKEYEVTALGDSFIFYIEENSKELLYYSSKGNIVEFDNYPDYFSSLGEHKGTVLNEKCKLKNGIFILATDAISKWIIDNRENAINEILLWESYEDFKNSIHKLRINKEIENDDSTIIILEISDIDGNKTMPENFNKYAKLEKLIEEENAKLLNFEKLPESMDESQNDLNKKSEEIEQ